jgi:hypothetical protein
MGLASAGGRETVDDVGRYGLIRRACNEKLDGNPVFSRN